MSTKIILDDRYEKTGSGWESEEMGVQEGDVRLIDGVLHYAGAIYSRRWGTKKYIWWWPINSA